MNISINKLLELRDIKIIDIRNIEKYNNNHIPGAINIPYNLLINNPKKYLNKEDTYYLYCQKGLKSLSTCNYLNRLGYKAVSINGGYESWLLKTSK